MITAHAQRSQSVKARPSPGRGLPAGSPRRWRPGSHKLAQKHDAAEVVVVVRAQALQLLANGHGAVGLAGAGWAADEHVEPVGVASQAITDQAGGFVIALEESPAQLIPFFAQVGL